MHVGVVILGLVVALNARAELAPAVRSQVSSAVLKLRAVAASGAVALGSAVMIERGKLVTSCHVTRNAAQIEVMSGAGKWRVEREARDTYHDLCILWAPAAIGALAQVRPQHDPRVGEAVFAAGYPNGGGLSIARGQVEALHAFDGGNVIQTSAEFTHGASGGGLFDREGRLAGVLAFKARAGGVFHFALPSAWLAAPADADGADASGKNQAAFWEQPSRDQPYFLRATSLEIEGKWQALSAMAQDWLDSEPENAAPRTAMNKAIRALASPPAP